MNNFDDTLTTTSTNCVITGDEIHLENVVVTYGEAVSDFSKDLEASYYRNVLRREQIEKRGEGYLPPPLALVFRARPEIRARSTNPMHVRVRPWRIKRKKRVA